MVDPAKFPKPPPPTLLSLVKLLQYPPITIVSLNSAILFAAYYAMAVTFPLFLEGIYGFTTAEVGVAYLAPGALPYTANDFCPLGSWKTQ